MHAAIIRLWPSKSRKMNWSDIRYFLAVARHGGLMSAAKQLDVSRRAKRSRVVSDLLAQVIQGQQGILTASPTRRKAA